MASIELGRLPSTENNIDTNPSDNPPPVYIKNYFITYSIQACTDYLKFSKEKCQNHRFFGKRFNHLYHGNSGRKRVETLKKCLMNPEINEEQRIQAVKKIYLTSGNANNSFSRYLEWALASHIREERLETKKQFFERFKELYQKPDEPERSSVPKPSL